MAQIEITSYDLSNTLKKPTDIKDLQIRGY